MEIKSIPEQKTSSTCLAVCLMTLLKEQKGIDVPDSEEIEILIEGISFTKIDYSTGQLIYLCEKFNVDVEQFVEFPGFCKELSKLKIPKKLTLISKKVDKRFLKDIVQYSPVIIYLDNYALGAVVHTPHFVILNSMDDEKSVILDPWDGKRKEVETKRIIQGIAKLRNLLKYSPKVIRIL